MTAAPTRFPDVTRTDAGVALVTPLYVGTPELQRTEVERILTPYRSGPLPEGFLSVSVFTSTEGENVLTYAQWTSDDAYRAFVRDGGLGEPDENTTEPVRYKLYRGRVLEPGSVPTALVAPVFDVDGRDRQRRSIDNLVDGPLGTPFPGLVASHFHMSLDGTRVLNWAEWVDEAAHEEFMKSSRPKECLEAITMPGVRGIGGKRYILAGAVGR
ncbi:monooxygenase [Streptomyces sp. NPDC048277]|uniref:monooxygenase n=1 Tax=Streptomyces sp. NPDC048277 TaxID=3155027 RepID=UPI0034099880